MSRPVSWILSKPGLKVCCELGDAEYQALPQSTLVGLVAAGVKITRSVRVPFEEFLSIGGIESEWRLAVRYFQDGKL